MWRRGPEDLPVADGPVTGPKIHSLPPRSLQAAAVLPRSRGPSVRVKLCTRSLPSAVLTPANRGLNKNEQVTKSAEEGKKEMLRERWDDEG